MAGGQRLRGKGDRAFPQDDVRHLVQSLYVLNTILYVFTVVLGFDERQDYLFSHGCVACTRMTPLEGVGLGHLGRE